MKRLLLAAALSTLVCAETAQAQPSRPRGISPVTALAEANADARRRPDLTRFRNAMQVYDYAPAVIYELYAAPGFISTALLEPGETIVTVAAGDTSRWMVEEATGGDMEIPRAMLLIKPTQTNLRTNIVLITDRRTYSIEAVSVSGQTYSAQTAWRYPAAANAPALGPIGAEDFNLAYRIRTIRGATPRWRPTRAFDDGRKTYIEFPSTIATSEAPPLFITESGEAALVNYRVVGNRYVVDRLFDRAELRLGAARPTIVRISREAPRRPTAARRRTGGNP